MKTIKVIDLLNKIANGEELPKKIDYNGEIFIYNEYLKRYVIEYEKDSDSSTYCLGGYFALDMSLDHEIKVVEIIEEDKEIEEIPFNNGVKEFIDVYHELEHYNYKINELIKAVNELKKGK